MAFAEMDDFYMQAREQQDLRMPPSVEMYSQWMARAGRDGKASTCVFYLAQKTSICVVELPSKIRFV